MILMPDTSTSLEVAVGGSQVGFASAMALGDLWMLVSNTACWVKQGSPTATIVCDTNANMADGDTVTINDGINAAVVYEYDKASNGVAGGHVVWAAGTTAASVATNLAAAINGTKPNTSVVATAVGSTVTVTSTMGNLTTTKTSTSGMTVAFTPQASAGAGSMFVPANVVVILGGQAGTDASIIQDAAGGKASLTRCLRF